MEQSYLFKNYFEGNNKNTGAPFKILELHNPTTLENTSFFLRPDQTHISLIAAGLVLKDKLIVTHGVTTYQNKPQLTIEQLRKG